MAQYPARRRPARALAVGLHAGDSEGRPGVLRAGPAGPWRLRPHSDHPREALEADEVNGFPIPATSVVALCQYVTHRHPDFWEQPGQFKPERFLPGQAATRPKFAYFP
jgi:hypothetical protein